LIHQRTDSPSGVHRFLYQQLGLLLVGSALIVPVVVAAESTLLQPAIVVAAWLMTSATNAVAQRAAFRFLPTVRASQLTIAGVGAVIATVCVAAQAGSFDLIVLLCGYAAVDGAPAAAVLWALRLRVASTAMAALTAGALALGIAVTIA
jgi:hypothetical protein